MAQRPIMKKIGKLLDLLLLTSLPGRKTGPNLVSQDFCLFGSDNLLYIAVIIGVAHQYLVVYYY